MRVAGAAEEPSMAIDLSQPSAVPLFTIAQLRSTPEMDNSAKL